MNSIANNVSAFQGVTVPNSELIAQCMHCGLCLPHCPTYSLTGMEKSSPRGRIRLIKAIAKGELQITKGFIEEMNFCLDCQACETACPAGVKYGSLVETAREQITLQKKEPLIVRNFKRLALSWLFKEHSRLKFVATGLRMYEASGLRRLLEQSGFLKLFSTKLHDIQPLTPTISKSFSSDTLPEVIKPAGIQTHRVAFLTGCIMDVAFADVNIDTVALLTHHGCEVIIPKGQGCCGSLQAHNGFMASAKEMARHNIEIFSKLQVDSIVMNSAGCGAYMKEYTHLFEDDQEMSEKARQISAKIQDITEFLLEIGLKLPQKKNGDPLPFQNQRVSYHDACHLVHTQKISQQPRILIKSIPQIQYIELPESTWCCGSAGIYNVVHYDEAMKLLDRKVQNIRSIQPDWIVTGNPGCMIQIQHGLNKGGLSIQLIHTATFLRRVCEA
ncbi:MAG: (Fe-S)-binding protein [bacterium]